MNLNKIFQLFLSLCPSVSSENDWDFCGVWRHGKGKDYLSLNIDLTTGCNQFIISANDSSLSISGQITAQCKQSVVRLLNQNEFVSSEETHFCLFWEPLLDQMKLQVRKGGRRQDEHLLLRMFACSKLQLLTFFSPSSFHVIRLHNIISKLGQQIVILTHYRWCENQTNKLPFWQLHYHDT